MWSGGGGGGEESGLVENNVVLVTNKMVPYAQLIKNDNVTDCM